MQLALLCTLLSLFLGISTVHCSKDRLKEWTRPPFVKDEKCLFRVNPGPCHGNIIMFGYDPFAQQCSKFSYSGCGGNPNRFSSEIECRQACKIIPKKPDYAEYTDYPEEKEEEGQDYEIEEVQYPEYKEYSDEDRTKKPENIEGPDENHTTDPYGENTEEPESYPVDYGENIEDSDENNPKDPYERYPETRNEDNTANIDENTEANSKYNKEQNSQRTNEEIEKEADIKKTKGLAEVTNKTKDNGIAKRQFKENVEGNNNNKNQEKDTEKNKKDAANKNE